MRKLRASLAAQFRIFRTDVKGAAAIEFAFLVPVLLFMTFGTVEMSRALIVNKRFQKATSMVGDLVTREKQLWPESENSANVTTSDAKATLAGIMKSVSHSMQPYSTTPLTIRVYQVWANLTDPTKTKIEWSYQYPTAATTGCGTAKSVDNGVLVGNGRAVFVEAQYKYTPLLGKLLPAMFQNMNWTDTMVMTPRDVPSVMYLPGLNNSNTWDSPSVAACQ
jgi:Flp pilus assembly protein TadG